MTKGREIVKIKALPFVAGSCIHIFGIIKKPSVLENGWRLWAWAFEKPGKQGDAMPI